jgi:Ala-tRNA(Pro) deacylase
MSEPIDLVKDYLDQHGVDYEVVPHEEGPTAAADARAVGVTPQEVVKDVVLTSADVVALALIPASERLDLKKAQQALELESRPDLATEDEIHARFPEFEVGALPPCGPVHDLTEIVDRRPLEHDRVHCASGDHRHSVRIAPTEIVRLSGARVADLCQE